MRVTRRYKSDEKERETLDNSPVISSSSQQLDTGAATTQSATLQMSGSKKVWRLKKYTKTDDQIQLEQQKYSSLEFTTKKSSPRRPKNRPGQSQEFVFVDLSPKKRPTEQQQLQYEESPSSTKQPTQASPKKQGNRMSRLFRLSGSSDPEKTPAAKPNLTPLETTREPANLALKRSYSAVVNVQRHPQSYNANSDRTALKMTVSEDGRAVLQPQHGLSLSASSSISDFSMLSRHNSFGNTAYSRSPLHSPKRSESPQQHPQSFNVSGIPTAQMEPTGYFDGYDEENDSNSNAAKSLYDGEKNEDSDALKAFAKVVSRRKRANTGSSTASSILNISPIAATRQLSRNRSISSISSLYKSRISPTRVNLIKSQAVGSPLTTPTSLLPPTSLHRVNESQPLLNIAPQFSFFDDSDTGSPQPHHRHTASISENIIQLGPPLETSNSSDNESEPTYTSESLAIHNYSNSEFFNQSNGALQPDDTIKNIDNHEETWTNPANLLSESADLSFSNNDTFEIAVHPTNDSPLPHHPHQDSLIYENEEASFFDMNSFITYDNNAY